MALKLEVFETANRSTRSDTVILDVLALEEAKLSSYDAGYTAGWEDAAAAQSDDQGKIKSDLSRNLQSLNFTYQEARAHVLKALEPLMLEIVGKLLPELARGALAPVILQTLMPMAESLGDAPISILINPSARSAVEELLERATGLPLTIIEEPTLGEGQAYLRLGDSESLVDLDEATRKITTAVHSFFEFPKSAIPGKE